MRTRRGKTLIALGREWGFRRSSQRNDHWIVTRICQAVMAAKAFSWSTAKAPVAQQTLAHSSTCITGCVVEVGPAGKEVSTSLERALWWCQGDWSLPKWFWNHWRGKYKRKIITFLLEKRHSEVIWNGVREETKPRRLVKKLIIALPRWELVGRA